MSQKANLTARQSSVTRILSQHQRKQNAVFYRDPITMILYTSLHDCMLSCCALAWLGKGTSVTHAVSTRSEPKTVVSHLVHAEPFNVHTHLMHIRGIKLYNVQKACLLSEGEADIPPRQDCTWNQRKVPSLEPSA